MYLYFVQGCNFLKEKERNRTRDLLNAQQTLEYLVNNLVKEFDVFLWFSVMCVRLRFVSPIFQQDIIAAKRLEKAIKSWHYLFLDVFNHRSRAGVNDQEQRIQDDHTVLFYRTDWELLKQYLNRDIYSQCL